MHGSKNVKYIHIISVLFVCLFYETVHSWMVEDSRMIALDKMWKEMVET
jgi:hypothetical protein